MTLSLRCPACRGPLEGGADALSCAACRRSYPILFGIPDLRLSGDRYLDLETDRARASELDRAARDGASFEDLLALYWRKTPGTPAANAARHIAGARRGVEESRAVLEQLGSGRLLDAGCGAGGALLSASRSGAFTELFGIDTALRWLVLARVRMAEAGLSKGVTLVAASIEALPFPDESFDAVLLRHLLEHVESPGAAVEAAGRVLVPGGRVGIETFQRWAVTPEPHVGLFGAAWLPRQLQARYVRWRSGSDYSAVRLPSRREVTRALKQAGLTISSFVASPATAGEREALPRLLRPFVPIHDRLGASPRLNRMILSRVGPLLRLTAIKSKT